MEAFRAFSDWLQNHSIILTEAIRQCLILAMVFGWVVLTNEQLGVVLSAVSAVLAVFTSKSNVSSSRVEVIKDKAHAAGVREGTGTGSGGMP